MVWPVRSRQLLKVSSSSGADPAMNSRMLRTASRVNPGSASRRTYSVGTPMNTVASGSLRTTVFGSNFDSQIILLPLSSAPCSATNKPCT